MCLHQQGIIRAHTEVGLLLIHASSYGAGVFHHSSSTNRELESKLGCTHLGGASICMTLSLCK